MKVGEKQSPESLFVSFHSSENAFVYFESCSRFIFFSDHETRVMLCVVVSSCEKGCFLSMKVNINSENNILILFLTSSLGHISNLEGERSAVFVGSKIRSSI